MSGHQPTPWTSSDYYSRRVENAAGAAAGTVGAGFGAAKLRDAYKQDYPHKVPQRLDQVERAARKVGLGAKRAKTVRRLADEGHPGFRTLAAAAALGAVATAGKRIRMNTEISQQKKLRREDGLAKADYGQELGKLPRRIHLKGIGVCRVVGYHGPDHFEVIDPQDSKRLVHRSQVNRYIKKGMPMSTSAFGVDHGVISKAKLPSCGQYNCRHLRNIISTPHGIEQELRVSEAFKAGHSRAEIEGARKEYRDPGGPPMPPMRPGRTKHADHTYWDHELKRRKRYG